jgi:taurine dioxygenase
MTTTGMDVERLAGSCGANVRGLDVSVPQSPEQIEAILSLLDEHLVIALPRQALDLDRLEAFTDELGARDVTPFITPVEGRPHVLRVIKEPTDELNFANAWHTDLSTPPPRPRTRCCTPTMCPPPAVTRCGRISTSRTRRCPTA